MKARAKVPAAVARAHALQASGEEGRALQTLVDLVQADPKSGAARGALADFLALHGRPAEAVESYEKALALEPKAPAVLMSLARLYLRHREEAKAEEALRRAVALDAGPEAALLLGELLKSKGLSAEAAPLLKRAASAPPAAGAQGTLAAGLTRFRAHINLGAYAEAFAAADALLSETGSQDCIDSFFVSPEPKRLMETLDALKAFAAREPKNPWPRYFRAALLSNMGRGEEAIAESQMLTAAPKRWAWMRHKHGELLLANRRDYAAAEAEYAAAVKCVPGFWKARAVLAEIGMCRGRTREALQLAEGLAEGLDARARPWAEAVRGRLLLWAGDYAGALAALERPAAEGVPSALRHRGAARLLLGRLEEASADLEAAAAQAADAEGLTWRGEARRQRGELKGALEDLNAAVRLDGANSIWALANRALLRTDAAALWADYSTIRRDVLDRFETAAGRKPASPADAEGARAVLEAGLKLARGVRVSNEYLFPVWMGHAE